MRAVVGCYYIDNEDVRILVSASLLLSTLTFGMCEVNEQDGGIAWCCSLEFVEQNGRKKQTCHSLIRCLPGCNGYHCNACIVLTHGMHTIMAYSQSSGIFDRWIYAEIIKAGLDDWTPEDYIRQCGSTPYRASVHDLEALSFLSSCCLVSKEWLSLARPLLYASWRIGQLKDNHMLVLPGDVSHLPENSAGQFTAALPRMIAPQETVETSSVAPLVRYLGLHTYNAGEAARMVSDLPFLPNLSELLVGEGSYPFVPFYYLRPYEGANLTKLAYRSGSVQDLARLMSVLPHLKVLRAGGFLYQRHVNPPEDMAITCRLENVSLHHSPRYVPTLFEWMFQHSKESIRHLTVSKSHTLFKDILPFLHNAHTLTIEIKTTKQASKTGTDQYDLATNLARFKRLEKVSVYFYVRCEGFRLNVHGAPLLFFSLP